LRVATVLLRSLLDTAADRLPEKADDILDPALVFTGQSRPDPGFVLQANLLQVLQVTFLDPEGLVGSESFIV
jgi:hypothetical protein